LGTYHVGRARRGGFPASGRHPTVTRLRLPTTASTARPSAAGAPGRLFGSGPQIGLPPRRPQRLHVHALGDADDPAARRSSPTAAGRCGRRRDRLSGHALGDRLHQIGDRDVQPSRTAVSWLVWSGVASTRPRSSSIQHSLRRGPFSGNSPNTKVRFPPTHTTSSLLSQMPPEPPSLAICPRCRELKGHLVRPTRIGHTLVPTYTCGGCFCVWIATDPEPMILD
jgi:hypothetical protein